MVKKEFTEEIPKTYDDMSDVNLIEELSKGTLTEGRRDTIKAILDKGTKKTILHLTEVTQKNSEVTEKHNVELIRLTKVIATLTFLMLIGLGLQVYLTFDWGQFSDFQIEVNNYSFWSALSGLTGAILVFFFGLPPRISEKGEVFLIAEQTDEKEKKKARLFKTLGYFGIALIALSFLLQLITTF